MNVISHLTFIISVLYVCMVRFLDRFTTRQPTFGNIPLYKHHKAALKVLKKLALMKTKLRPGIFKVMIGIRDIWDFRIMNALPDSWNEAKVALRGEDMGLLYQPHATRSIQWLNENGKCIDHIVPKQSTIGGAGHGAFAKRDLPKGTIITGSPLLHVPHYKIFHIYDYDEEDLFYTDEEKPKPRRLDTIIGEQVALNYCFGNANSTLLVCPCKTILIGSLFDLTRFSN